MQFPGARVVFWQKQQTCALKPLQVLALWRSQRRSEPASRIDAPAKVYDDDRGGPDCKERGEDRLRLRCKQADREREGRNGCAGIRVHNELEPLRRQSVMPEGGVAE